jgi:hypothetical protein
MRRALLACVLLACSSSSNHNQTDASSMPDAPNPPAMGLGKVCDGNTPCPATAPTCATLMMGAPHGFCTLGCGTSTSATTPPMDGQSICANAQPPPGSGTPGCALVGIKVGGNYPWNCAVLCGPIQNTSYGSCPAGLVCMNNVCQ